MTRAAPPTSRAPRDLTASLIAFPLAVLVPLCATAPSGAQEMPGMPAATAPSPGVFIPRIQTRAYFLEDDQFLLEENIRLEYGLVRDLSLSAEIPLYQGFLDDPRPRDGEFGLGDADVLVELRILREDLNAVDTVRASVFAGAELPTATDGFAAGSLDPCLGAVFTAISGRHGIDLAARYTFVTGDGLAAPIFLTDAGDDFLNLDAGYAFRIHPEAYTEEREPAWYLTAEINSVWTMGGEHEVLLSPGLLIEAPTYALEFGCSLPLSEDQESSPRLDFALLAGIRLLF
jgi:hypothetical protein